MKINLQLIGILFVVTYIFFLFFFFVKIVVCRRRIQKDLKEKGKEENIVGSWHAGEFFSQPLLPIDLKGKSESILDQVKSHNKYIKWFWLNTINLMLGLYILGNAN